jgi:hypothetical protein
MSETEPVDAIERKRQLFLGDYQPAVGADGRDALGRFAAGNPGRARGSRNRVAGQVVAAVLDDFQRNEADNFRRLRRWYFPDYIRMVSRLLPRPGPEAERSDTDEAARMTGALRAAIDRVERGEATLDDLRAALAPGPDDISNTANYGESTEGQSF